MVYDLGDESRHDIFIESVGDGEVRCRLPGVRRQQAAAPARGRRRRSQLHGVSRRGARPLHVEHKEVVTWYAKPFDLVDLEERWVRLRPATLAAHRRSALARHRGAARSDST